MRKPARPRRPLLRAILWSAPAVAAVALWRAHEALERRVEAVEEAAPALVRYAGRAGPGEGLPGLLERGGSPPAEAVSLARRLSAKLPGRSLRPGDRYEVLRSSAGALVYAEVRRGRRRYAAGPRSPGVASEPPAERQVAACGAVASPGALAPALRRVAVPADVVGQFASAFRWRFDFATESAAGDRFALVWTERRQEGRVTLRRLEAARYRGRAGEEAAFLWDGDYYDGRARALRRRFLRAPLDFQEVSSPFGRLRLRWLPGWRFHRGTDYAAPRGTPVASVAEGRVAAARWERGYGNIVRVIHGGGLATAYAHLERYGRGLKPGAPVRQGQVLGFVGRTGNASGPHLHFEFTESGRRADFQSERPVEDEPAEARRAGRFRERRDRLAGSLDRCKG